MINSNEENRSKNKLPYISVIIPAYNEEKTIHDVIQSVKELMISHQLSYEIIVVNDGSKDKTRIAAEKSDIRIVNLKRNLGKGSALSIGFKEAKGSCILTVDADGSHQKKDISALISRYLQEKEVHMLLGSRFMNKPKTRFTSSMNLVGNKLFKYLLFIVSRRLITDSQTGLRVFSGKINDMIELKSKGYELESELTCKAIAIGCIIKEIPITCKPRFYGTSHLNSLIDGIRITKTILLSYLLTQNTRLWRIWNR